MAGLLRRTFGVAALACGLVIAANQPALANTCAGNDYHRTFLETLNPYWDGVKGELSLSGNSLPNGSANSHLSNWFQTATVFSENSYCPGSGGYDTQDCGIQGGWATGNISGQVATNDQLFVEKQDVYYYYATYYSSVNIGTSDAYKAEYGGSHTTYNGTPIGLFNIYYDNHVGNGYQNFGQAWLPFYTQADLQSTTEAVNTTTGPCPVLSPYENWGHTSGLPYHVQYSLYGQGMNYSNVTDASGKFFVDPHGTYPAYEFTVGDPSMWKVTGG